MLIDTSLSTIIAIDHQLVVIYLLSKSINLSEIVFKRVREPDFKYIWLFNDILTVKRISTTKLLQ